MRIISKILISCYSSITGKRQKLCFKNESMQYIYTNALTILFKNSPEFPYILSYRKFEKFVTISLITSSWIYIYIFCDNPQKNSEQEYVDFTGSEAAVQMCSKKKCSENMQQIYRRTPMPRCDFNKVALQIVLDRECGGNICVFDEK